MVMIRLIKLTLIPVGILILFSCQNESSENKWPRSRKTSSGNYTVTLQLLESDSIKQNEHFSLELSVSPKASTPPTAETKIVIDADMPAHQHGMNTKPELSIISPGKHRVNGMLLHMAGDWIITVKINQGAGRWEYADFPISIEP